MGEYGSDLEKILPRYQGRVREMSETIKLCPEPPTNATLALGGLVNGAI